ncbi:hypothetical protein Tsubulata_029665 [Turnera subulata]|uniref:Uncharacterized protein n=1 Tax=Turnera subulata TaxID=218843 RepID=A0A9Q0FUJ3_9ROSI|nr:hypothetical protein Tsubulata_029665 [Turnera subulata]
MELEETLNKHWRVVGHGKASDYGQDFGTRENCGMSCGIHSWNSSSKQSGIIFSEMIKDKNAWEYNEAHSSDWKNADPLGFTQTGASASELIHPLSSGYSSTYLLLNKALEQRREVALSQSLFSALLSLLVGMIIWEAEDPCMPLVVALFIVVGMSLKSVVLFFSTIRNKPASEAVALLSFNWFILGTLTYPTLPKLARLLTPLYSKVF